MALHWSLHKNNEQASNFWLFCGTRFVQLTLLSICPLSSKRHSWQISAASNQLGTPIIKFRSAGWEAGMLPLCFAALSQNSEIFCLKLFLVTEDPENFLQTEFRNVFVSPQEKYLLRFVRLCFSLSSFIQIFWRKVAQVQLQRFHQPRVLL